MLRKDEVDDIVSFFYNAFKSEGVRKPFSRIRRPYTGISIKRFQKWFIPFFLLTIKNLNNRPENLQLVKQLLNKWPGQTRGEN